MTAQPIARYRRESEFMAPPSCRWIRPRPGARSVLQLPEDGDARHLAPVLQPFDDLVHSTVQRTRPIAGQPQQVSGVVVDLRSPFDDVAGHRAVSTAQARIER